MGATASSRPARSGVFAVLALVLVTTTALVVWLARESSLEARMAEALAPYEGHLLPEAGDSIDFALAGLGADLFGRRCAACHTIDGGDKVGPALSGITVRRTLPYIEGMILRPDSMTRDDPVARELKERFAVQMVTPSSFRAPHALAVIEFLRQADLRNESAGQDAP